MKVLRMLFAVVLASAILVGTPELPQARVMMTGSITGFGMDIKPAANFTVDDWMNTAGMWTITVTNGDGKTVKSAVIHMELSSGAYGSVISGDLTVVGENRSFLTELRPGQSYTVNNTMINEDTEQMSGGAFSQEFKDEVLRIGYLPEGNYTMSFVLNGYYETSDDPIDEWVIYNTIEIKNPTPPDLITPDDTSDDVVTIPRFSWQRPLVSDVSSINNRMISIFYTINVWKMFGEDGSVLTEEDAINRIPIWRVKGLTSESVDFDPGTSREEFVSGRKYCWQVQALDGTGYPISSTNEGKSDVWEFTCQFSPPNINEPLSFYPFGFTWTAAQAGGGLVLYRVRIADNADFAGGYMTDGLVMTSFTYPQDAPRLRLGVNYYLELQATDDSGIPIGEPATTMFTVPASAVTLRTPADGAVASTTTPRFSWQGRNRYYVVMMFDEESDWNYVSGSIEGLEWVYDGEEMLPGKTYAWNVSPANDMGDPVGESSSTWYFSLAAEDQVTLISPINEEVDSITPTFSWREVTPPSGQGTMEYTIIIEDENGSAIHTATVTTTTYQYPQDAPELGWATMYLWSVNAEQNNAEIGRRSERASFTTPFAPAGTVDATMENIGLMIKQVISSYPQYASFLEKVLISISDESGPMAPEAFLELFETYKIISVSSQ